MAIDPKQYGVSFSIKQCHNFDINPKDTLDWLIQKAGLRRFRLMSYWNEHEKRQGAYDFTDLDWQIQKVAASGGVVSLALGARQPRWPENHWPDWAWKLSKQDRTDALLTYITKVVERYKKYPCIISYQLENEALLKAFGERPEVDRRRLRDEYNLVATLDPTRPIIMTTSTSWGIPVRKPTPTIVGFSYYQIVYGKKGYSKAFHTPRLHRIRAHIIRLLKRRPVFIHELQLEPWGPKAIWEMPVTEQNKSMSPAQIAHNLALANKVGVHPIDLWGGEWWYWRVVHHKDPSIWQAVKESLTQGAGPDDMKA